MVREGKSGVPPTGPEDRDSSSSPVAASRAAEGKWKSVGGKRIRGKTDEGRNG